MSEEMPDYTTTDAQAPAIPPVLQAMADAASKAIGIDILPDVERSLKISSTTRGLAADPHPALLDIVTEFARQERKWGVQDHTPPHWIAILVEEVGEASKAAVNACLGGDDSKPSAEWLADFRKEMVQVAAVATQIVACIDRGEWEQSDAKKPQPVLTVPPLEWVGRWVSAANETTEHAFGFGHNTFRVCGNSRRGWIAYAYDKSVGVETGLGKHETEALAKQACQLEHEKIVRREIGIDEVPDAA